MNLACLGNSIKSSVKYLAMQFGLQSPPITFALLSNFAIALLTALTNGIFADTLVIKQLFIITLQNLKNLRNH